MEKSETKRRFEALLGADGVESRIGLALGTTPEAGRVKAHRWLSPASKQEVPVFLPAILELLEALARDQWPQRWREAAEMEIKRGRPTVVCQSKSEAGNASAK